MIKASDLKKALNGVLRSLYSEGYRFYGKEVSEGYEKPSFFTELVLLSYQNETTNFRSMRYGYYITYFQKDTANGRKDEADALKKWDEIRNAYGLKIKVGKRFLNITGCNYEWVGEKRDILQVSLYIDFIEEIEKTETAPIMQELTLKEKMEVN